MAIRPKQAFIFGVVCLHILTIAARGDPPQAAADPPRATVRTVSLRDCIELSLRNRLNLLVRGMTPDLANLYVKSARGIYDPTLTFQFSRNYIDAFAQFDVKKTTPGLAYGLKDDTLSPGLTGTTPWGMTYSLAATESHWQANRYGAVADPALRFTNNWVASVGITLRQPLLKNFLTDAGRLRIELAKKDFEVSEYSVKAAVIGAVDQVIAAYYELMFAREQLVVARKALELSNQLLNQVRTKIVVGDAVKLDEIRLVSAAETAQADVYFSDGALRASENVLKQLLAENFESFTDTVFVPADSLIVVEEFLDKQQCFERAMTNRTDLLQKKIALEKMGLQVRFTRNQKLPAVDAFGSYGFQGVQPGVGFGGSPDSLSTWHHPFYSLGVVVSYPLLNTVARNNHKIAVRELELAELEMKKQQQLVLFSVDTAIELARAAYRRTMATRMARLSACGVGLARLSVPSTRQETFRPVRPKGR